jgi:hypothetical protein
MRMTSWYQSRIKTDLRRLSYCKGENFEKPLDLEQALTTVEKGKLPLVALEMPVDLQRCFIGE